MKNMIDKKWLLPIGLISGVIAIALSFIQDSFIQVNFFKGMFTGLAATVIAGYVIINIVQKRNKEKMG